jgi:hypothetical protein
MERLIQQAPGGLWHNMSIENLQRYTDLSRVRVNQPSPTPHPQD